MSKAKKKKNRGPRKAPGNRTNLMERSDIPYAQRMALQHQSDIKANRDHAAKIAMYCNSIAMYEEEGIGYKRLIRFAQHFKEILDEFYEDPELGMAHAKRRLEQMGMPISGEYYSIKIDGLSKKSQEIQDHRLQAVQIALICSAIAMNDVFGFGQERQFRISQKADELSGQYNKKGEKFLLDKMKEIGFVILDGEVIAFSDDDGNAITHKQWREQNVEM